MKVDQQKGYILHTRAFKDSSAQIECLTLQHGLVSLIARGAKRPRSRQFAFLQPFMLLQISWMGRSDLKTLTSLEAESIYPKLVGSKIVLGLYLNELLIRLLQHLDPHPQLFYDYGETLHTLSLSQTKPEQQHILRRFEINLLHALGYGLDLSCDAKTGDAILPELLYSYDPQIGIYESSSAILHENHVTVSGATIMALQDANVPGENELREAKKLMRYILSFHLGSKPLYSRKLYGGVQGEKG